MKTFLLIASIALIAVILVQIGKVSDLAKEIRGQKGVSLRANNATARALFIFMILFLVACVASAYFYKDKMLAYGPNVAASLHGVELDNLFNWTLFFTGVVFFVTQFILFYFAWKFRMKEGRVAKFFAHDNKLEIIWTLIPTLVMSFLVVMGLIAWNDTMKDVEPGVDDYIEIEATGEQFLWHLRYPGKDGRLGERDYRLTSGINPLGQNWEDAKNHDDFMPSKIVLPVNQQVRVRITAKDVLHNFFLPYHRVKMDAVPGTPTYFVFTPTITTAEYRERLRDHPDWQGLQDPSDPESGPRWKSFNYVLACAELCGEGHFSMKREVEIVTPEEYSEWLSQQQSYYYSTIRGTKNDPLKDKLLDYDLKVRKAELDEAVEAAIEKDEADERTILLNYVQFETGSDVLTPESIYELNNLVDLLNTNSSMELEISGHTDNTGDEQRNKELSQERADAVKDYLVDEGISEDRLRAVGYGSSQPIDTNETEDGRKKNRRTEFKILTL